MEVGTAGPESETGHGTLELFELLITEELHCALEHLTFAPRGVSMPTEPIYNPSDIVRCDKTYST